MYYDELLKLCGYEEEEIEKQRPNRGNQRCRVANNSM